jgi:hypothetical protein
VPARLHIWLRRRLQLTTSAEADAARHTNRPELERKDPETIVLYQVARERFGGRLGHAADNLFRPTEKASQRRVSVAGHREQVEADVRKLDDALAIVDRELAARGYKPPRD